MTASGPPASRLDGAAGWGAAAAAAPGATRAAPSREDSPAAVRSAAVVDRPRRRCPSGDAGVAAVLVLSLASVVLLVGALSTSLAAVAVARQRAAAVADLSALAAAAAALDGPGAACARAARIAAHNGGSLSACAMTGDVAEVVAQVRPPGLLGRLGLASGRARAGPVGSTGAGTVAPVG